MSTENKQIGTRLLYLDFLRILATAAVIILHTSSKFWYSANIHSFDNIWDSCVRWSVPVFTMISGALFLNPDNEIRIKKLYTKNIFRIITAFIFGSFVYALNPFSNNTLLLNRVFTGHYHLWFLFLIIGFYITVPVLREITKSEQTTKYFLIISFIFNILAHTFFDIVMPCFPGMNTNQLISALYKDYNNMNMDFLLGYTFYFVLGYYLSRHTFCKKLNYTACMLTIIACFLTAILTYITSLNKDTSWTNWYNYLSLNIVFESIGIFLIIKKTTHTFNQRQQRFISTISKCTFGIYLVHIFILELLINKLNLLSYSAIIMIPSISLLVFLSLLVISAVLNKIPVIKQYIVRISI